MSRRMVALLALVLALAGCGGDNLSLCDGCEPTDTPTVTPSTTPASVTPTAPTDTPTAPTPAATPT